MCDSMVEEEVRRKNIKCQEVTSRPFVLLRILSIVGSTTSTALCPCIPGVCTYQIQANLDFKGNVALGGELC